VSLAALVGTLGTALVLCGVLSLATGVLGFLLRQMGTVSVAIAGMLVALLGLFLRWAAGTAGVAGLPLFASVWQVWVLALILTVLLVTVVLRLTRPERPVTGH